MAIIENIKQKIAQLEAGAFQNLCNSYLYRIGYKGIILDIVSLGAEAGTQKTTKGTPDSYFCTSDAKYVFVEYSTQKTNLFRKIKDDLAKCMDSSKTGIPLGKISEIIYCHTSSNITTRQNNEIKTLCANAGINLKIIGIDKLAEDLYSEHHILARDFLGISINTDQIQSYNDFVENYNLNQMAAPIDTEFLFRDKEIEMISEAYQEAEVVILSGAAGTGKTRLALHYAKKHSDAYNEIFYCIHDNAQPIFDDLKLYIDSPGNYFILIDDANKLSGLQQIVRYTRYRGYTVKILITVRDYSMQKVIGDVREITSYKIVCISAFTDGEIKKLLEIALGIKNRVYYERIIKIADGNARIAMLAGKVACNSRCLDSIKDVSQLYENYYGSCLQESHAFVDNNMLVTAGIVAFLGAILLEHIDILIPVLQEKGISQDIFIENIDKLYGREIVDICHGKAVQFSDQCLSNYFLKYIFFDRKLLRLSSMIKVCFQYHRQRTVSSINSLLSLFVNEDVRKFVREELQIVWHELYKENSLLFFEFVQTFYLINPTATFLFLQSKIELEDTLLEISDIDIKNGKKTRIVTNDIIKILGGFTNNNDLPTALDLFFQYYLKRPDLYIEFYHAANQNFGIKYDSACNDFYSPIIFLEKIKEYSNNWERECIVVLFLEIVKELLKFQFSQSEQGRKYTFTTFSSSLTMSKGVEKYRWLIWLFLYEISSIYRYKEKIREVLESYGHRIESISIPVLEFDLEYIKSILESFFPVSELRNCILADRLVQIFNSSAIICTALFSEYFMGEPFYLYILLRGPVRKKEIDINELKNLKTQAIEKFVDDGNLAISRRLIDICHEMSGFDDGSAWEVQKGLGIAFDIISSRTNYYVDIINYYLEKNTPFNLYPNDIVRVLFSLLPDSEVFHLINNSKHSQSNAWLYAYFCELPVELITEKHLQELYLFLEDNSDKTITSSALRDVGFLEKYITADKNVFIKGCNIILNKMKYSPFMVSIYFDSMFNAFNNTRQNILQKFNDNLELLEDIYCMMQSCNANYDFDGEFLKEIYLIRPSILDRSINYLILDAESSSYENKKKYLCFFQLNNFNEIYDIIFDNITCCHADCCFDIQSFWEILLLPQVDNVWLERQDEWIRHSIKLFATDTMKMCYLFSAIYKLNIDRKKEYIRLFLENNQLFEDFEKLPLIPQAYGWSGSVIPLYSSWIEFLESLLPSFIGLKWVRHKNYVELSINNLKMRIKYEEINAILTG